MTPGTRRLLGAPDGSRARPQMVHEVSELSPQFVERQFVRGAFRADQQPTVREPDARTRAGDDRTQPAPQPVAAYGVANRSADGERDAQGYGVGIVEVAAPQGLGSGSAAGTDQLLERPALANPPNQADSRVRPLRRRALMIARPARVRMRARNPCLRARRRVFGWNVRFTIASTSRAYGRCLDHRDPHVLTILSGQRATAVRRQAPERSKATLRCRPTATSTRTASTGAAASIPRVVSSALHRVLVDSSRSPEHGSVVPCYRAGPPRVWTAPGRHPQRYETATDHAIENFHNLCVTCGPRQVGERAQCS